MPPVINSLHIILTLIAIGILAGAGWQLVAMAFSVPSKPGVLALIICLLVLVLAWVVP